MSVGMTFNNQLILIHILIYVDVNVNHMVVYKLLRFILEKTQLIMAETYSIRDLANEFGVTTRTLRFYEQKGLLTPIREKQSRTYTKADRTRLRLILRGKRLGFSLEESQSIISMYDPKKKNDQQLLTLIGKIREKREQLLEQRNDLELMLKDLDAAEQRCLDSLKTST